MAILRPESCVFAASGTIAPQANPYFTGAIRVAAFPGQTGVTIANSGGLPYLVAFRNSGGTVEWGPLKQLHSAAPYVATNVKSIADDRLLSVHSAAGRLQIQVWKLNADLTMSGGLVYAGNPHPQTDGWYGLHNPSTEIVPLRTSGDITKVIVAGKDWWKAPPLIHVVTVSGMTVQNVTFRQTLNTESLGRDVVIRKIDDYTLAACTMGDNRLRFIRVEDDDTLTFGTEHAGFEGPAADKGAQVLRINESSGVLRLDSHKDGGSNAYMQLRPFTVVDGEIRWPQPSGFEHQFQHDTKFTSGWGSYGVFGHRVMCPVSSDAFAVYISNQHFAGYNWAFQFTGAALKTLASGMFTPLPTGQLDDRPEIVSMAQFGPASGFLLAYRRQSDGNGVLVPAEVTGLVQPSSIAYGTNYVFSTSGVRRIVTHRINDDDVLLAYQDVGDAYRLKASVVRYSATLDCPPAAPMTYADSTNDTDPCDRQDIVHLDGNRYLVIYPGATTRTLYARTLEINGLSISLPDQPVLVASGSTGATQVWNLRAERVGPDRVVMACREITTQRPRIRVQLIETSGGTIRIAPYVKLDSTGPTPGIDSASYAETVQPVMFGSGQLMLVLSDSTWSSSINYSHTLGQIASIDADRIVSSQWQWIGSPCSQADKDAFAILNRNQAFFGGAFAYTNIGGAKGGARLLTLNPDTGSVQWANTLDWWRSPIAPYAYGKAALPLNDHTVLFAFRDNSTTRGYVVPVGAVGVSGEFAGGIPLSTVMTQDSVPDMDMASDGTVAYVAGDAAVPKQLFAGFITATDSAVYLESGVAPMVVWCPAATLTAGNMPGFVHGRMQASGSMPMALSSHVTESASLSAFLYCEPFKTSGFIMLAVSGVPGTSALIDIPSEELLRTHDHDPFIVAQLELPPPGSVTIEVWHMAASGVELVPIISNECHPIGNTGAWQWSTGNLPEPWPNAHPMYHYRMTAPGDKVREGQFVIHRPASFRPARVRRDQYIMRP